MSTSPVGIRRNIKSIYQSYFLVSMRSQCSCILGLLGHTCLGNAVSRQWWFRYIANSQLTTQPLTGSIHIEFTRIPLSCTKPQNCTNHLLLASEYSNCLKNQFTHKLGNVNPLGRKYFFNYIVYLIYDLSY